jgi:hypothetical protein
MHVYQLLLAVSARSLFDFVQNTTYSAARFCESTAMERESFRADPEGERVPGTEFMKAVGQSHGVHIHSSASDIVLIPQPSDNPHDPLVSLIFLGENTTGQSLTGA